jgi:hypothetical protein
MRLLPRLMNSLLSTVNTHIQDHHFGAFPSKRDG